MIPNNNIQRAKFKSFSVFNNGLIKINNYFVIPISSIFLLVVITALTIFVATNLLLEKDKYFIRFGYSFIVKIDKLIVSRGRVRNLTIF